jgi:hypothetical protein
MLSNPQQAINLFQVASTQGACLNPLLFTCKVAAALFASRDSWSMALNALFGHGSSAAASFVVFAVTAPGAKRWSALPAVTSFIFEENEMDNQPPVNTKA